jgi:hypothetical protein
LKRTPDEVVIQEELITVIRVLKALIPRGQFDSHNVSMAGYGRTGPIAETPCRLRMRFEDYGMPSHALLNWQNSRLPRLNLVDVQNAAFSALVPPNPELEDENLRGYVMLLAAHFQGFCRDLHSECIQASAIAIPAPMLLMFQTLCQQGRELDKTNAKYAGIKADYERFGLDLTVTLRADPTTVARNDGYITQINHLNAWRNYAAHHNALPPPYGGPFSLPTVRLWKDSCNGLAIELDRIMYNQLQTLTGVAPWVP